MKDCATSRMRFETQTALALEAAFDGGRITSDGGLLWLAQTDSQLGLCQAISEHVPEWRKREGCHSLSSLIRQRVFQIACGYEDQNDSNSLREDPLLKVVCGSLPEDGPNLASQPTISRLENAADVRCCYRIARVFLELYLRERGKGGAPEKVLLDFDATADPTHGEQEGSYYHGYYEQHMYHPLLVFDGESGHLISALLRAGNTHASNSAVALLKRIVGGLRKEWPEVAIELRADAGFAVPALYDYCEEEGITYTVGLIKPALGWRNSPAICSMRPKSVMKPKARRQGSFLKMPTRPEAGRGGVGSSTRPRRWKEGPTPASSLPRGPMRPKISTNGT